jgi:flagellar capping protein FliD
MNSDSTNKLPNDVEKYDTQPGITAVLERLNALDEKWERRFSTFEGTQQEMLAQLRKLTQQFEQSCEITGGGLNN